VSIINYRATDRGVWVQGTVLTLMSNNISKNDKSKLLTCNSDTWASNLKVQLSSTVFSEKKKSNIYYFFSEKTVERHCIQCLLLSWNFRCCRLLNASWW